MHQNEEQTFELTHVSTSGSLLRYLAVAPVINRTGENMVHVYGTVSRKFTLVILFKKFQDKEKKSNARIEIYG